MKNRNRKLAALLFVLALAIPFAMDPGFKAFAGGAKPRPALDWPNMPIGPALRASWSQDIHGQTNADDGYQLVLNQLPKAFDWNSQFSQEQVQTITSDEGSFDGMFVASGFGSPDSAWGGGMGGAIVSGGGNGPVLFPNALGSSMPFVGGTLLLNTVPLDDTNGGTDTEVTPEPGALLLLGSGLTALGWRRRLLLRRGL